MDAISHFDPTSYSVLVVDDDESLLQILIQCLEDEGYSVSGAGSGDAGLKIFQQDHFDLVISDIMMPRYDGRQLLTAIVKIAPNTPVLMMTGYSDFTEREALQLGAAGYFKKPFGVEELYEKIETTLHEVDSTL